MNTTDCEKIECKLSKEFNFQGKFEANFEQLNNVDEMGIDKGFAEVNTISKVDTFNMITKEESTKDLETHQVLDGLISLQKSNSCMKVEFIENITATTTNATDTHTESIITLTPPTPTTLLFTQETKEEQILSSHLETTAYDGEDSQLDFEDTLQPLSERWSPLGANYDDAVTPSSELLSPVSELELLSSDSQDKPDQHADDATEIARLKGLEEEQEMLTSSLMALTSHFAHVQLRVRQIVEAPPNERDQLLKDLEEFAFQGIPENSPTLNTASSHSCSSSQNHDSEDGSAIVDQRQFELIDHLKSQLSELEKIAYESGAPVLPQHILLEKQKIIIDELKHKLNLKVDENMLPELTADELKCQVDNAIGEFVGPLKMKEQLVAQLKTQITDLERFIAFLQCDTEESKMKTLNGSEKLSEAYNSYSAKKKQESKKLITDSSNINKSGSDLVNSLNVHSSEVELNRKANQVETLRVQESLHSKAHGLMDKASVLMQMFATTHFGSKQEQFQKNTLKKTNKGNHWGDLRAQLEVDIQEVASLAATLNFDREKLTKLRSAMKKSKSAHADTGLIKSNSPLCSRNRAKISTTNSQHQNQLKPYNVSSGSDDDDDDDFDGYDNYDWQQRNTKRIAQCARIRGDTINTLSKELTTAVRKNFAMTLLKLMQHGLRVESIPPVTTSLIVPFMRCLNPSPVFVAEHNYRARDFDASSFMPTTASFGYEDTEGSESSANWSSSSGGLFSSGGSRPMHAWELILEYYYLKHGDEYNNTPARKLSQSFNLDIVNSQAVTAKQNLLCAVGSIIAMHRPYKRSYNAHFKAFVCAGLNSQQLVEWLNLIFSCNDLIENYYANSSYVACTGFRDALRSIDTLSKYDFDLPVDLAIRHFRHL